MGNQNYHQYQLLKEKANQLERVEGISEHKKYEIGQLAKDARKVQTELGFHDKTQAKLYLCAKLDLEPSKAIEMVNILGSKNMDYMSAEVRSQLP